MQAQAFDEKEANTARVLHNHHNNTTEDAFTLNDGTASPTNADDARQAELREKFEGNVPLISNTRLAIAGLGIWISLFLAAFETTVVATSLIKIASDFNDFNRASWIVVVYLLTYNGFLLLSSKLCDILGIKTMFLVANGIFALFSMLCGASKSMNQLIIFRAFQGIGGGGIYCISFILMMSIISKEKLALFSGGISSCFAISSIAGPLLGGLITTHTTWRWIFYLNGPGIAVAFALLYFALPNIGSVKVNRDSLRRIDYGGGFLSVAWAILLVFALQEGGADYPWKSATIVSTLTLGILLLIAFAGYEAFIAKRSSVVEPIFPLRLLKDPAFTYQILTTYCVGTGFYVIIIQMPQRFQIVNGTSAIRAGVLLLPMLCTSPIMSLIPGILMKKHYRYMGHVFVVGAALSLIGAAGLGTIGTDAVIHTKEYVFLVLAGMGMGLVLPISVVLVKFTIAPKDEAVALGAQNMTRVLGGLVGLSICSAILHQKLESNLSGILSRPDIEALKKSSQVLARLDRSQLGAVRAVYARAFDLQLNLVTGFAGLGLIFAVLTAYYARDRLTDEMFATMMNTAPKPAKADEEADSKEVKV